MLWIAYAEEKRPFLLFFLSLFLSRRLRPFTSAQGEIAGFEFCP
jgi:hypothetical protein